MNAEPDAWKGFAGVGPKLAERLAALGIARPEALLTHLPLRYEDRTRVTPLGTLQAGASALIAGEMLASEVTHGRRPMLVVRLGDGTGFVTLRFFHFYPRLRDAFRRGDRYVCYGDVRAGSAGLELVHPTFCTVPAGKPVSVETRLTPVYPTVAGLTQAQLRRLVRAALAAFGTGRLAAYELDSVTPGRPTLGEALNRLHAPLPGDSPLAAGHPVIACLAFDELLAQHLALRRLRHAHEIDSAPNLAAGAELAARLAAGLPFPLTRAQRRAQEEIAADLAGPHPMNRLLQGDVGSGKTVVAALAAAQAAGAGFQAALMAPTELLAEQHLRTLHGWFEALGVPVGLLTASTPAAVRRHWTARAGAGEPLFLIGTHALISKDVGFARLALAIVDEQHRFGVGQRLALAGGGGGEAAHQLVMTATPIPRTLAMTLYADLDVSTLDERPPGRKPVVTAVMSEERRGEIISRIGRLVAAGRQAYWVCPLIEESEVLDAQAAEQSTAMLTAALPDVSVALIHGRLSAAEKDAIMRRFVGGEIGLMVATTVIEVGVDVPNATLMVVENAERLGLAQLHQLRGRIGRGSDASHCVLLYKPPLSAQAAERLATLRASDDGFVIAEADLRLRGPGEFAGTRQAGLARLKVADLARDRALLARVAPVAERLLAEDSAAVEGLIRFWLGTDLRYARA